MFLFFYPEWILQYFNNIMKYMYYYEKCNINYAHYIYHKYDTAKILLHSLNNHHLAKVFTHKYIHEIKLNGK